MRYTPFVFFLTLTYLMLTSNFEWLNIIVGILIAIGITLLLRPRLKVFSWRETPQAIVALLRYLLILAYDIVSGGVMVARVALSRHPELNSAIIAIPSECTSELATALSAHAISIAPGELVVEIDDNGVMYTHVLDASHSPEYKEQAQKLRRDLLQRIFS
jgi:multicomponent Na+:H+ antiporter subunit E